MADYFFKVGKPGSATTLSSPGHTTGGTSITVGSTANWPTTTKVAFAIDRAEIIAGEEVQIAGTYTEWTGQVTGATTIGSMVLSSDSPNSDQNYTAGSLTRVYIPVSATRENKLVEGILQHANQDGTLITQAVRDALSLGSSSTSGWEVGGLPNITSVVHNGNRSYTLTHASSVASTISEGMRRRFTRTVAANTYMGGAFNGSSHYFTKTSPTGTLGTVTNNFTIEATYQPTTYTAGTICGRLDAAANNGIYLYMQASGVVTIGVRNAGAANYREITTYQSLPLNKKTPIAVTWTSGTVTISFDGISVPVAAATTGGTAPTTAGTGGDWSIGRFGASGSIYANGYISNVAAFDAVLSAATIKQHATYKLTGSETNCIGAWSLDNTAVNQQAPGTNDLTATGGVGYTNISPFGNNGVSSTLEYGLTMSVSSDGLTEVVQCPEGCAIPTTGGVSATAYSVMASPFGFVSDKGRWEINSIYKASYSQSSPTAATWYNLGSARLNVPIGSWSVSHQALAAADKSAATVLSVSSSLSTSASTDDADMTVSSQLQAPSGTLEIFANSPRTKTAFYTTATPLYLIILTAQSSVFGIYLRPTSRITATPSNL